MIKELGLYICLYEDVRYNGVIYILFYFWFGINIKVFY